MHFPQRNHTGLLAYGRGVPCKWTWSMDHHMDYTTMDFPINNLKYHLIPISIVKLINNS